MVDRRFRARHFRAQYLLAKTSFSLSPSPSCFPSPSLSSSPSFFDLILTFAFTVTAARKRRARKCRVTLKIFWHVAFYEINCIFAGGRMEISSGRCPPSR
jgi:hypothetical protein